MKSICILIVVVFIPFSMTYAQRSYLILNNNFDGHQKKIYQGKNLVIEKKDSTKITGYLSIINDSTIRLSTCIILLKDINSVKKKTGLLGVAGSIMLGYGATMMLLAKPLASEDEINDGYDMILGGVALSVIGASLCLRNKYRYSSWYYTVNISSSN